MKTKRALRSKPDHAYKCHRHHPPVPSQEWSEENWGEHKQCHLQSPGSMCPLTLMSCPVLWRVPIAGPTMMFPARQALKRSKPSLAGLSHALSDKDDDDNDNEECVCGGENERRGGRHRNEYCWMRRHEVKMSKQKMKTKSEIMMLLLHHLKRKPFNLLPLLDEKVFRLEIS